MQACRPLLVLWTAATVLGGSLALISTQATPAVVGNPPADSILVRINTITKQAPGSVYGQYPYMFGGSASFETPAGIAQLAIFNNFSASGMAEANELWLLIEPDGSVWQTEIPLQVHHQFQTDLKPTRFRGRPCVLASYYTLRQDEEASESTYVFHDGRSFAYSSRWHLQGASPDHGKSSGALRLVSFPPPESWLNPPPPPPPPPVEFPRSFPLTSAKRLVEETVASARAASWEGGNSTVHLKAIGPPAWRDPAGGGPSEVWLQADTPVTVRLEGASRDTTAVVGLAAGFRPTGSRGGWQLKSLVLDGVWELRSASLPTVVLKDAGTGQAGETGVPKNSAVQVPPQADTTSASVGIAATAGPSEASREDRLATFVGTWGGEVDQGGQKYPVMIGLKRTPEGSLSGTIQYPTLHCSGSLRWQGQDNGAVIVGEILETGPCEQGGTIRLRIGATGDMEWRWLYPDGREGARASLSRQ